MATFKFCPKCGTENTGGDPFCSNCGNGESLQGHDEEEVNEILSDYESIEKPPWANSEGEEVFWMTSKGAAMFGFTDDDGYPWMVECFENEEGLTQSPLMPTYLSTVSLDGETVTPRPSLKADEDLLSKLVLLSHFTQEGENEGVFPFFAPPQAEDARVNRLRRHAVENFETLDLPDPVLGLVAIKVNNGNLFGNFLLSHLKETQPFYEEIELTDMGADFLDGMAFMGCILKNDYSKIFEKIFSRSPGFLDLDAATFASALCPDLKSVTNIFQSEHKETDFLLQMAPERKEQHNASMDYRWDKPFFTPIDLLWYIATGIRHLLISEEEGGNEQDEDLSIKLKMHRLFTRERSLYPYVFNAPMSMEDHLSENNFSNGMSLLHSLAEDAFLTGGFNLSDGLESAGYLGTWLEEYNKLVATPTVVHEE